MNDPKIIRIRLSNYTMIEKIDEEAWKEIPNKNNPYIDHTVHELSDAAALRIVLDSLITKSLNMVEVTETIVKTYYLEQVYGEH
jgi:hypothetical protein